MGKIDFRPKTDRELLIIVAEQGNATREDVGNIKEQLVALNGTLLKHEIRLVKLEGRPDCGPKESFLPKINDKIALITLVGTLLAALVYSLGRSLGIW